MKTKIKWLKENLSIILIVPALIGGLWQILELSSISTSYIRFFSASQVIPDGLLVLFILTLLYVAIKIGYYDSNLQIYKNKKLNTWHDKNRITTILLTIFNVAILTYAWYFILWEALKELNKSPTIFILLISTSCIVILLVSTIHVIFTIRNAILSISIVQRWLSKNDKKKKRFSIYILFIAFPLFIKFILIPLLNLIGKFRNEFVLPLNLKNLEYIECKVNNSYNESLEHQILYLNDSHIFIEIKTGEETKDILVLKFEDLLSNNCK